MTKSSIATYHDLMAQGPIGVLVARDLCLELGLQQPSKQIIPPCRFLFRNLIWAMYTNNRSWAVAGDEYSGWASSGPLAWAGSRSRVRRALRGVQAEVGERSCAIAKAGIKGRTKTKILGDRDYYWDNP